MKKTPILQFPRLLNLEKRMGGGPVELSVDQIKILEKKLIFSIQEISSSLEKEDPNTIKEESIKNALEPVIKADEKMNEKQEIIIINQVLEPSESEIQKLDPEISKSEYKIEEQQIEETQKPILEVKFPEIKEKKNLDIKKTPKQSIAKRKIEDNSKQACLDEYFIEKPLSTINENSMGATLKMKPNKTNNMKSPLPMSPLPNSNMNFGFKTKDYDEYEKEIKGLKEILNQKERESKEKERLLGRLNEEKARYKEIHENFIEDFLSYKNQVQKLLSNYLLECERYKKNEIKTHLSSQRHRLGEYISQRNGSRFEDIWVDGYELRNLKEMLNKIATDKEELKASKKNFKKGNKDAVDANILLEKTTISHRIKILQNEEEILKEKIEKLNEEIFEFVTEYKKQYEEDHSKYGKPNQTDAKPLWPILGERYQLLSLIGKGGFSEVYKAFDLEDFHLVACKIHELNPIWTENLKQNYIKHATREIEIHKNLNHINIVKLCDIVEINSNCFCTVLEYCEGPDLGFHLKRHKTLPEKEARLILKQIVNGVKYLNEYTPKIIHYDLKPQNILFHKGLIKLSDFGLCKILDDDNTKMELTSQGLGTYWYLPPECFQTNNTLDNTMISPKVDVWSIGVIFYEMLYGVKPFGNSMSQEKILQDKVILRANTVTFPSSPSTSNDSKEFISKCLEYDQFKRPDIVTLAGFNYVIKK